MNFGCPYTNLNPAQPSKDRASVPFPAQTLKPSVRHRILNRAHLEWKHNTPSKKQLRIVILSIIIRCTNLNPAQPSKDRASDLYLEAQHTLYGITMACYSNYNNHEFWLSRALIGRLFNPSASTSFRHTFIFPPTKTFCAASLTCFLTKLP
ncbi:hypothetical protein CEXT_744201 [Caerostris extrusa]|uniref:Uncharacterized protein n=1 Tax=Caerostris extrusa TaxID=172846 RepID=A0AAV4Q5A1_CAEEX|nr:hypothetical protein CEXT_744201 [Caerostris extrusa]